eukprot:TRINITY_DN6563_c0_g1_i1.p2 TRINITY_DN6563_c0_g1~~TRINITY_DN6563_c0_g1_i1.p2  ORF type:complete len:163 (+),score=20.46 TRINITY_DN6563_c0_g1_i1:1063-1551(+)
MNRLQTACVSKKKKKKKRKKKKCGQLLVKGDFLKQKAVMGLRIRLARDMVRWRPNKPYFEIRVADNHMKRDGKHVEKIGWFDPVPAQDGNVFVGLDFERVKYWLSNQAEPSKTMAKILARAGIIPPPVIPPLMHLNPNRAPRKFRRKDRIALEKAAEKAAQQ